MSYELHKSLNYNAYKVGHRVIHEVGMELQSVERRNEKREKTTDIH